MTFEDVLQNPAFAYVHKAFKHLQNTPASQLAPKKHALALTLTVEQKVIKLYNKNPNMPIKKVIREFVKNNLPIFKYRISINECKM
jgi:hypothetical protein